MTAVTRVPDLLGRRVAADPELVALAVDGAGSLTYAQWARRSDAVAAGLAGLGVRPGDRVVLYFDNTDWVAYAVCYIGVHKAGGVAVPASPRFTDAELAGIVDQVEPALLVCADHPPATDAEVVRAAELEGGSGRAPGPLPPAESGELAEIIYTSGTTGSPKGVACPHASILVHDLPGDPAGEPIRFAHAFPIGTNAAQACLHMLLRRSTTAVVLPTFDPGRLCAAIAERGVQRLQLVPAMAEVLVSSGAVDHHDCSSVQQIILSSAPASPALWSRLADAFPGAALFNTYALTESGSARTLMRHDPDRPRAVGRPVGRTEVRIVDGAGGQLPPGDTGEILLRRPGAPRRFYYGDPEATAAAFEGDWLRTGDLGYLDEQGFLHLVDRKKDLIISGGVNISSVEVQDALCEHPAVRDAAVFGVEHPVLGEDVAAAVVLAATAPERELQSTVRARLGEHKVPRRIHVLDDLPRNASGKVDKQQLRERLGAPAADQSPVAPRDDLEQVVLAVWRDVLGREDIGVHDDFFELGGHSLAAAQIVARLEDELDRQLPVTLVFEEPTVAEVARAVAETPARVG